MLIFSSDDDCAMFNYETKYKHARDANSLVKML